MYILTCIAMAIALVLYIFLMKHAGKRRKHALKLAEQQLAALDKKKRAQLNNKND